MTSNPAAETPDTTPTEATARPRRFATDRRSFLRLGAFAVAAPVVATALDSTGLTRGLLAVTTAGAATGAAPKVLMDGPARDDRILMEGLPVGNGRIGALVGGRVDREQLALNENSLWGGGANPSGDYATMETYKTLGAVFLELGHDPAEITGYRRELDVATGVVTVRYRYRDADYVRETFVSFPDQVIVMTVTTTAKRALSGRLSVLDGGGRTPSAASIKPGHLSLAGTIGNGGVGYGWYARLDAPGAKTLTANVAERSTSFTAATSLTVVIGARTDYTMDYTKQYRGGPDPAPRALADVTAAMAYSRQQLRRRHVDDFTKLFARQSIDLGASSADQLAAPTFERVQDNQQTPDPQLYALYYQFARYLTISASRPGGVAMNLQGIWNVSDAPPWNCDYHNDINIQMCYWLSDPANLAETTTPLVDFMLSQIPAWRVATQAVVHKPNSSEKVRGWTVRVSNNTSGGLGWDWQATGSAWLAWHLWDHYTYTMDEDYLRERAYPVLKEVCQYLEDLLVDDGSGKLVVPDSWSPEHSIGQPWRRTQAGFTPVGMAPYEDGVSMDQELAWDAFSNFVDASTLLGLDADYRATVTGLRDKLHVPAIGSWGQLQEWYDDRDRPDVHHRHLSHLVGVFPGRQITAAATPELFEAARVSLTARGIGPTGWSAAWNANLWASFGDADKAMQALENLIQPVTSDKGEIDMNYHGGVYPNLFDAHPPFQIDGNIGGGHAFIQILAASSIERIELLKALPARWPAGSMTGIRARGGFELDLSWSGGKLTQVSVHSLAGRTTTLSYGNRSVRVALPKGRYARFDGSLNVVGAGASDR